MNDLYTRLDILKDTDTITVRAKEICQETIKRFVNEQCSEKYTMLITHLAMAITRIERSELLSAPPQNVMKEVYDSPKILEAIKNVSWIENELKQSLPPEEKEFLLMHFVNILS